MIRQSFASIASILVLSLNSLACGSKGTDEEGGEGGETSSGATGGTSSAGKGGSGGTGASTAEPIVEYNFDEDAEGWAIVMGTGASTPAELQTEATLEWVSDEGGALKVTIPFTDELQSLGISISVPEGIRDMTGRTLEVRAKLVEGLTDDGSKPGGIQPFGKSGEAYIWAQGAWTNIGGDMPIWLQPSLVFETPDGSDPGYDFTDIREVGVKFGTGTGTVVSTDAVLLVDWIRIF